MTLTLEKVAEFARDLRAQKTGTMGFVLASQRLADEGLSMSDLIAQQAAEIHELRAGNAQLGDQWNGLQDMLVAQQEEIERLKHALARITAIQKRTHKSLTEQTK